MMHERRRSFRPRWVTSLVALSFVALFARLGVWQIHRYNEAADRSAAIRGAWEREPIVRLSDRSRADLLHRRVQLEGQWSGDPPALIHGGPIAGEPGYQAISRLRLPDSTEILVDRGWVPVDVPEDVVAALARPEAAHVDGLLVEARGAKTGPPTIGSDGIARWPLETDLAYGIFHRVVGPPYAAIAGSVGSTVRADIAVVTGPRLDDEADRKRGPLPVPGYTLPLPRTHHLSYAAQWLGFAAATIGVWIWLSLRRTQTP
jgi:surfeit locus 1 family protein